MTRISIADIIALEFKSSFLSMLRGGIGKRWYAVIEVKLHDDEGHKRTVRLLVCSQEAKDRPYKNMPVPDDGYTIVDREVDMKRVRREVEQRISGIHAKNWESASSQIDAVFPSF